MKHLILIFFLFLTSCINDVNSTSNVDSSYELVQSVPDIDVRMLVPFNGFFTLNQTKDITVRVKNVGSSSTTEKISILCPYLRGFTASFDNTQTSTNNPITNIDNTLFTVHPMSGGNVLVTTDTILEPGKTLLVTFKLTAVLTPINNITNIIGIPYTGGEINLLNNSSKTNVTVL